MKLKVDNKIFNNKQLYTTTTKSNFAIINFNEITFFL
jgi:hypothetical protein